MIVSWTLAAVLAATFIVYWYVFRGKNKAKIFQGDTIIFVGNSGVGKTILFSQLFRGTRPTTVNSIEEEKLANVKLAEDTKNAAATVFNAVCIPGNLRLRRQYRKYLPLTAGIVLVVDACDPDVKGTAALLHELLVNPIVDSHCPPILIACTKNDIASRTPHFCDSFLKSLERELDIVKSSQNSVAAAGASDEDVITLGVQGQAFKFAEDSPCEVHCDLCAVGTSRKDIDASSVEKFIRNCFPASPH